MVRHGGPNPEMPDVVAAEAAAWLARLQVPERTRATEAAFKMWLAASPAHARAFEAATEVWDLLPGAAQGSSASAPRPRRQVALPLAASVAGLLAIAGALLYGGRDPVYATDIGEQQVVVLDDGTRVALNTDSRVSIDYSGAERRVTLARGEALFEVAKNPARPFIVTAGDEEVRALGTTFVVRHDTRTVAVTLIEGRVALSSTDLNSRTAVLTPGERATVTADEVVRVDRPKLDAVIAWRRGEVMFDDAALTDAIAELDRYGGARIRIDDPALGSLRISGVFDTTDVDEFATSVAALHGLAVVRDGHQLRLQRRAG